MQNDLARSIANISRPEGSFLLRSGQHATHYFDKYRFEAEPEILKRLAKQMIKLLPTDTEVLAGLELGGVPIATAMSLESGIPCVFVRKQAKTYGTCRAVEGRDIEGYKTTIIEDVISTGGAVSDAAHLMKNEGAQITSVVCAIWRGNGKPKIEALPNVPVIPAFTDADLSV